MLFVDNTLYLFFKILVIILGTFSMTGTLLRLRCDHKRSLLIFAVYLVCTITINFLVIHACGYMVLAWMCLFTTSIPGIFVLYFISEEPPTRLIFIYASHVLASAYVTVGVTLFNTFLHGNELTDSCLRLVLYVLLALLEYWSLRRPFLNIADTITTGWGVLSLIPCSFLILGMTIAQYPTHYTKTPSSVVLISLLVIVIIIIYYAIFQYLWTQYGYRMEEQNREILELQIRNIKSQAADIQRKAQQAHMDTLHMLSAVASLAKTGNTKAILDYVSDPYALNNMEISVRYCSDPILNATLSTYLRRAGNSGILLETYLSIPDTLPVDSAELSICFANALENAINACEKLPKNERKIIVKCIHKPKLMFEISNPYKGKISFARNGLPYSSKTGHGIGTRSIMAFCEKHGALCSFIAEDGWFKVTVAL